jgi:iron complex outermembrane receptor protein
MQTRNYKITGALNTTYNKNGLSPMPSLIYKPYDNVTYYLTYASSLQQGDIAPGTGNSNPNQALAPYRSTEYEAGAKYFLPKLSLAFAVFRVERPFAYASTATSPFEIQGNQVNKGVEASVVGKLTESLRILSGATLIDATMQDTLLPATNGCNYVGLPKLKSNIMLEYWVPSAPGLVGTLDWQFNGKRPVNDVNSQWTPSYSVFNLGARYSTRLCGKAATWRLAVNNLTDVHFWSTIGPSNITGADSGNMTAHLGAPRTVAASMSMTF